MNQVAQQVLCYSDQGKNISCKHDTINYYYYKLTQNIIHTDEKKSCTTIIVIFNHKGENVMFCWNQLLRRQTYLVKINCSLVPTVEYQWKANYSRSHCNK